jgi:UDP-N-acetylglucosamine diphosphorylase / glucose-1-phosphate thymidylyltransferase / UDP-N-acetylgalactosamine diphosphorylase / glucosamine-1-phosphate N-acetyltransferase / galactosamine-1-phosphate N-acetyltransferase
VQAVLLAGGAGKRVFPLSANKPKPMFKIVGKPLVEHVIERMKTAGLEDFVVVVGPNGAPIKEYLGDGKAFGVHVTYGFQKEPLGMANALESAKDLLEDNFFVVNADDVFGCALIKQMIDAFRKSDAQILLSCKPVQETWKFGIIKKENSKVTCLVEKPPKGQEPSNLAVIGVYMMTKKILNYFGKVGLSDHQYEDAIQAFIQDKNVVRAVSYDGFFAGYKYPWDLFAINQYLMSELVTKKTIEDGVEISKSAEVEGNVWIREGTKIMSGAHINGPAYIGPNSIIGNNSLVRNSSSIGANCIVGFSSEVKRSLIGDNCFFHMNFIGDSIISDGCMFGAGCTTANFRFDEKAVILNVNSKKVSSGENKLGVIVGENCKAGVNSTLGPGVKIGPRSLVGPGVFLQRDLAPDTAVFLNTENYVYRSNRLA